MQHLVISLIADDRPGLVESLAARVSRHNGNWLCSRMTRLAGKFAGIVELEVADGDRAALVAALDALSADGMQLMVSDASGTAATESPMVLEIEGQDRPGIVRDISALLSAHGVNVVDMASERGPAPMSGGELFSARFSVQLPAGLSRHGLQEALEQLAADIHVELRFDDATEAP